MQYGMRIIYCNQTGKVLNKSLGEMHGDVQEGLRPQSIDFIDLPYGYNDNNFKQATSFYVDVSKPKEAAIPERIVITEYISHEPSAEDRIRELEDQLLLQEDEKVGGIL